jgi:hypothetical protein
LDGEGNVRTFNTKPDRNGTVDRHAIDALAVNENAIAAMKIANRPSLAVQNRFGMTPAHILVRDANIAFVGASNAKGFAEFKLAVAESRFEIDA